MANTAIGNDDESANWQAHPHTIKWKTPFFLLHHRHIGGAASGVERLVSKIVAGSLPPNHAPLRRPGLPIPTRPRPQPPTNLTPTQTRFDPD